MARAEAHVGDNWMNCWTTFVMYNTQFYRDERVFDAKACMMVYYGIYTANKI